MGNTVAVTEEPAPEDGDDNGGYGEAEFADDAAGEDQQDDYGRQLLGLR